MKQYRIVCTWPGEEWLVQKRIEKDDHTTDWMEYTDAPRKARLGTRK